MIAVAALLLGGLSGGFSGGGGSSRSSGPFAAVSVAAPPNATAQTGNCTKVLEKLPVSLGKLAPRTVHTTPDTPFVVAWGDPAVIFSCGVAKPKTLFPGSGVELRAVDGLAFDLELTRKAAVYVTVDRAPYISVVFPAGVQPASYLPLLVEPISSLICSS